MVYSNKRMATEGKIKEAFIELCKKEPALPVSVKKICETAKINRSTFYTYYDDAYDLAKHVEEEIQNKLFSELTGIFSRYMTFDVNAITRELINLLDDNLEPALLFIRRNKEGYVKRIIKLAKDSMFFDVKSMTERELWRLNIALEYHLTGVVNILDHCIEKDKALNLDELIGLLAEIGSNGVFSIVMEYALKNKQHQIKAGIGQ